MNSYQLDSILADPLLANEIRQKILQHPRFTRSASTFTAGSDSPALDVDSHSDPMNMVDITLQPRRLDSRTEAIVLQFGRPSLLVKDGTFEVPASDIWHSRLMARKDRLDSAIRSVGRLELLNHSKQWAGTAWMITETIAVTNRHVALLFSQQRNGEFSFMRNPFNKPYGARIDFKEEFLQPAVFEIDVADILYVADNDDRFPDLAFLRLKSADAPLPPPIPLYDGKLTSKQLIAVIGYPAYDDRNGSADMSRIFDDIYGVKRLAPGEIQIVLENGQFTHDCSTLGGNSGSCVVDVETGTAIGLHFAGEYLQANFAVSASILREYLGKLGHEASTVRATPSLFVHPTEVPQPTPADLQNRQGYDDRFLGEGSLSVPLPTLGSALEAQAATVDSSLAGTDRFRLDYMHHTIVMNAPRRLAIYTATNIDGEQEHPVKRKSEAWFHDPRIDRSFQVGNELYRDNDLDRGHLTRRLDPAWGDDYITAEQDTFCWTNCTPQHHQFNTVTWLGLEDYLLSNTNTRDFRACVFTGPVLDPNDRPFQFRLDDGTWDSILLPRAYWKVAVMVSSDDARLSATAYLISQDDLISRTEFVFGQYETYQRSIRSIETITGLDFGSLRDYDPLNNIEGPAMHRVRSRNDIVI
jgi:endonuclease G